MDELEVQNILRELIRSPKSPAFTGSSVPCYEESLVSFIDTLGFSEFIKKSKAVDIANILRNFYDTSIDYGHQKKEIRIINFSDSTVRVRTPLSDAADEFGLHSPLLSEIKSLAAIQFELACWNGLFLRGGITFGNIFSDLGMVFGPALIEAYQLESMHATYPRILVHPKLIKSLDEYPVLIAPWSEKAHSAFSYGGDDTIVDGLSFTKMMLEPCLLVDNQENIFLDYLGMVIKGADIGFVLNHKKAIQANYGYAKDDRIREKYAWLKEYHNFTVSSGSDFREVGINEKNLNDFLISDDIIPSLFVKPGIKQFRF